MHELSIAQALAEQIEATMVAERIERIHSVTVRIGSLAGVERHALEMAFPIAIELAGLAPFALVIESVPAQVHCLDCGCEFSPQSPLFLCDNCDGENVEIVAGRELVISSMRVERS